MRKRLAFGFCLLAVLATVAAGCGGASAPSPSTVAARFFDGIVHADTRQACAQLVLSNRGSMPSCEKGYVLLLSQFLMFYGKIPAYQVVGHSVKTWTQEYRGREVQLATVLVTDRGSRSTLLKVWLRKTAQGWRIYTIAQVS